MLTCHSHSFYQQRYYIITEEDAGEWFLRAECSKKYVFLKSYFEIFILTVESSGSMIHNEVVHAVCQFIRDIKEE
ncbi:hypothetical protein R70331_13310 [Paenibacillus sp. FSL R7-0331]|nr:hypothetical protein R70331_13310 [Paenibacillus sp. FSL R7-0331]